MWGHLGENMAKKKCCALENWNLDTSMCSCWKTQIWGIVLELRTIVPSSAGCALSPGVFCSHSIKWHLKLLLQCCCSYMLLSSHFDRLHSWSADWKSFYAVSEVWGYTYHISEAEVYIVLPTLYSCAQRRLPSQLRFTVQDLSIKCRLGYWTVPFY